MKDKLSNKIKNMLVKGLIQFTILFFLYHCILDGFFMNTIFEIFVKKTMNKPSLPSGMDDFLNW